GSAGLYRRLAAHGGLLPLLGAPADACEPAAMAVPQSASFARSAGPPIPASNASGERFGQPGAQLDRDTLGDGYIRAAVPGRTHRHVRAGDQRRAVLVRRPGSAIAT